MVSVSRTLCLLALLLLMACAASQPHWASEPPEDRLNLSGLSLYSSGTPAEKFMGKSNEQDMAEASALQNARVRMAEMLGRAYVRYANQALNQQVEEASSRTQIEAALTGLLIQKRWYDAAQHRYHVLIQVPADQIEKLMRARFNLNIKINDQGEFSPQ